LWGELHLLGIRIQSLILDRFGVICMQRSSSTAINLVVFPLQLRFRSLKMYVRCVVVLHT